MEMIRFIKNCDNVPISIDEKLNISSERSKTFFEIKKQE